MSERNRYVSVRLEWKSLEEIVNEVFDCIEGIETRISQELGTVGQPVASSTPGPSSTAPIPQDTSAPGPSGASQAAAPIPDDSTPGPIPDRPKQHFSVSRRGKLLNFKVLLPTA